MLKTESNKKFRNKKNNIKKKGKGGNRKLRYFYFYLKMTCSHMRVCV